MAGFTQINLADLPAPDVIEALDFEAILTAMRDDLVARLPSIVGVIDLQSEPARKLLEVFAYRELMLRARINSAARAVMLAYAAGADLDNLAALFGVSRFVLTPAAPPLPAVLEPDADLRRRVQLAIEGYSVAGPAGAYIFHALSASSAVKDATAISPTPGDVLVTVLSRAGNGEASALLLGEVAAALNDEEVRPLCDNVVVQSASIISYQVQAIIRVDEGPDSATILAACRASLDAYVAAQHRLGRDVTISGIHAALHGPGVARVDLALPTANIAVGPTEAAYCVAITLTNGGAM